MTESKADQKQKLGKKSGNVLTMPEQAGVEKLAAEGKKAAAATAAQGNAEPTAAEVAPEEYKGAKKALRHALKARVKAERVQIAAKLVDKVKEGDIKGTEIVLSLMEKSKEENAKKKKKKRNGPSWAELLASEPEWDESMEDGGKKLTVMSGQ